MDIDSLSLSLSLPDINDCLPTYSHNHSSYLSLANIDQSRGIKSKQATTKMATHKLNLFCMAIDFLLQLTFCQITVQTVGSKSLYKLKLLQDFRTQ